MVMVMTGPTIRGEYIIDGQIESTDLAADSVGSTLIAANGVQACHLATRALSQVIRTTGPAGGVASVGGATGAYSANLTGFSARFAWALSLTGASSRFAEVCSIGANGSNVRLHVYSIHDAAGGQGSIGLVPNMSADVVVCWMT